VECPAFLKSAYLNDDRYRGFLEESASDACSVHLARAKKATVAEIERRLSRNAASGLGAPEGFLEKCLEQGVSVQRWQASVPASMPGAPIRPTTVTSVETLGDQEKKALTAEYYLSMNRLRTGSQSSLEIVAAIDSTLGRNPLSDRACDDSRLPGIDSACRRLQACKPSNGLSSQAAELEQVWPVLQELERKVRDGTSSRHLQYLGAAYGGRVDSTAIAATDAAIQESSKQLQLLRSMYPALEGKEFRKLFDPKKKNTREALAKQLEATRTRVLGQLESYRKAMDCLNSGFTCSPDCEAYPKALAQAPAFRVEAFQSGDRASADDLDVQAYLGAAECRQNVRSAQKEAADVVTDFAVGSGLTIATAGFGSIAAGAKAATTAANAARTASVGSRIASIGTKAGFARAAILGGDLYFAADGVNSAIDQCSEALNQLSSTESAGSTCPGAEDSKQVQIMADYRACVLSAALNITPNLLPFAPAFVKAYQSGTRRFAAAKPALERLEKARLLEGTAPGRYQGLMKSGEPVELVIDKSKDGVHSIQALSNGREVGQMKAIYDLQAGKYAVSWVEVADAVDGKSYRGEGLNSLMLDASLKELGGAEKVPQMMGMLAMENSAAFRRAKEALLEGSGDYSFEKNPRLKEYLELRKRALAEDRKLTEAELNAFSKEVELDAELNRKVFAESTPAGKMRADRGYEPLEVEVINSSGNQPVRYVVARKGSGGAIRPTEFISMKEVELASRVATEAKAGIVVLDANLIGPEQARALGVTVIDHHGAYRNADKPFQNTTRKIVDLYEDAAKAAGSGADAAKVREAFYRKLLNVPDGKPVPDRILVATDNLGDAALAKWVIDNPGALQSADSRRLLKMAAFHEDYAHFGTKYQDYIAQGGKSGANFSESVEFSQAVMGANDRIIRKYNAEAAKAGKPPVFVGDRFSDAPVELQQKIMAESVTEIDRAMKDPAYRKQLAQELRANLQEAVPQVRDRALVRSSDAKLATEAAQELGGEQVNRVLKERLAIIDGDKLDAKRGQFTNWGAIPESHSNPLQLQLTKKPGAEANTFILAIPQGREDRGLINEKLKQAIIDASKAKDPNFNPQGVVLRDSGLLFSFAGVPLSKQELSALVIRSVGEDLRPAAKAVAKAPVASWFPNSHSAEKLALKRLEPLDSKGVVLKSLDRSACQDCPSSIRAGSAMSHARQHFWEYLPPKSGESAEQWMARRVAEDGRSHVTSVFPPGVSQNQVVQRAQGAQLKAVAQGSDAVLRGKLPLNYVDETSRVQEGLFDVKIVVCRVRCEPNRPGDVISIFPISGPGVIKYEPRTGSLSR
jgi:hypothetical protein